MLIAYIHFSIQPTAWSIAILGHASKRDVAKLHHIYIFLAYYDSNKKERNLNVTHHDQRRSASEKWPDHRP